MKKTVKIIVLCIATVVIIVGIYYSTTPKMLDFRGNVTKIEAIDNATIFHISESSIGTSYTVVATEKTTVSHCHKDDPVIHLSDIKVGDTIEGNYRFFSDTHEAKFITVWCRNG